MISTSLKTPLPSSVSQTTPFLPCKITSQEQNKAAPMISTSLKSPLPSSVSQTSLASPCKKTIKEQNKSTSLPPTSLTLVFPQETLSQDQSNWTDYMMPVGRRASIGSLSVNSGSESLDSYTAAGFAFPGRLYKMLRGAEAEGHSHIVSWQPHGRCFVVHKPIEFVRDILHNHFNQTKLTSFQRQLNIYGFSRITTGPDRDCYHHPRFLRGRPGLCRSIDRQRVKGNGTRRANTLLFEPRFYEMAPCPEADPCASSRVPTVVSQISVGMLSKVQDPVLGTANCAWNQQDAKSVNNVSIPKSKEGESLNQNLFMLKDLPEKFLKNIADLEPEPIPFVFANVMDIMDRDAATLDKDVLSFLASCT